MRKTLALIGASALALSGVLLMPAAAHAATTTLALDCEDYDGSSGRFYVLPGDTLTLELTGCDGALTLDGSYEPPNGAPGTAVLNAGDTVLFGGEGGQFFISVAEAPPARTPSGQLLSTKDIAIADGAGELTVDVADAVDGEYELGGVKTCGIEAYDTGAHVYGTLGIDITAEGDFTFRAIGATPAGSYSPIGGDPVVFPGFDPIEDPFLALYRDFDPTNPDAGVVGCNDDQNDLADEDDALSLPDGTIVEGHLPQFSGHLTPGHYTLVLMTWSELSAAEFADGHSNSEDEDFTPGTKTVSFQLWGPLGTLAVDGDPAPVTSTSVAPVPAATPAAVAKPQLAATGATDAGAAWFAGLALLLGTGALVGARARSSRLRRRA